MVTELVTFKMEQGLLQEVDHTVKISGFQNRTEFIRAALREKIAGIRMQEAMIQLSTHRGKASKQTSDSEREKIRTMVSNELLAEYEKRLR